ncbi:DUF418 domain-containing protein [Actinomycetospora endophytica]|uniref:DUF418 domain-containing protein n=1 Tax=Actinomycetospora endophytica TaxID=2291215 RepID=A0ABS8PIE3_9PSEU|nr:DUF418 domain-containing protein [Actinomycetospora endophytica]MCD2198046.1 DUF418 domain-containing protein [Actinomycetospora endophytica]
MSTEPILQRWPRPTAPPDALSTPGDRISSLDVLRGVALCGILVVNVLTQLTWIRGAGLTGAMDPVIGAFFYERFMPIFATLFGVGFGLFLERAARRTDRPRVVLARRLAVLLVLGAVHQFFHVGEALFPYALVGLVLLLPLSFLGPRACAVVALVLLVVLPQIQVGYGLIAALLPVGFALARLGVPDGLDRHPGRVAVTLAVSGVIAVVGTVARLSDVSLPMVSLLGGGVGGSQNLLAVVFHVATALAYVCLVLLLLHTPARRILEAVFAPMGRMALTNYLTATVLFLLLGPALGIRSPLDLAPIVGLTVGILIVQAVWSPLWLRRFRYGPVEWGWRCLTWGRRAPLRRAG